MPYLNYLFCEKCGPPANLDVSYMETVNSYIKDGRSETTIDDRTIVWDYMVYHCLFCGEKYKYTFRDVEGSVRKFLADQSDIHRDYINSVAEAQTTEEDRLSGNFFSGPNKKLRDRLKGMYEK